MSFIPPHGGYENLLSFGKVGSTKDASYESYRPDVETRPPEIVAKILI